MNSPTVPGKTLPSEIYRYLGEFLLPDYQKIPLTGKDLSRVLNLSNNFPGYITNPRGKGLFCAFDLPSTIERDKLIKEMKSSLLFDKLSITELVVGDKCNAWNYYMHELADDIDIHFFVDADVSFSACCFQKMASTLYSSQPETVAIAGLPLSGRNHLP